MYIYGRNPVKEAYIAGKTVDKIFVQKGASVNTGAPLCDLN